MSDDRGLRHDGGQACAGLLPRRAYAGLAGPALIAAAGHGHWHQRVARELGVPEGTVRGWIRRARRSADQLRAAGVRAVVALDPEALPARDRPTELAYVRDALGAAAVAMGDRFGLQDTSLWARVTVLNRGRMLSLSPDG